MYYLFNKKKYKTSTFKSFKFKKTHIPSSHPPPQPCHSTYKTIFMNLCGGGDPPPPSPPPTH